jgi:hypothetical protein
MNSKKMNPEMRGTDRGSWNDWADIEARLNEIDAGREQVGRLAYATRFEWGSASSPKHD